MEDITRTGGQGYKALQLQNEEPYSSVPPTPRVRQFAPNQLSNWYEGPEQSPIMQQHTGEYWGSSRHDTNSATQDEWETMQQNPYEYRAQNQGALSKWGAGLAKGIGLAATTFLDGTIGLLYGVADAATSGDYSRIWDNEVSNALQDFNEKMEVWLPNYRTQEEQDREWWQNMGTANFWADGVLKNLGFTVGAYYSGAAWTKGLKALNWVKKATSAQVVGSLLSGLNEARIEANNGQREFLTSQNQLIDNARDRRAMDIAMDDTISDEEKIVKLQSLDDEIASLKEDALKRAHQMGLTTLIGNTVLLSVDNLWQFGKLYGRGFTNAKGLANRIEVGAMREGIEDVVEDGVLKYAPRITSKGRKIARGLSNGLVEGNEEMAQAFISETAGYWKSPDSPDAYYEALLDPEAKIRTKNFLTALADGFNNSYGSRDRWEEFAVGAFTGLLGMPTFGKVANSDANTWIGKGRTIGISGGVFGEYRSATQAEREAMEATDVMNRYMDKLRTQANYFAQSQSFTDAMDGFAAESNNFEYKNASNNDDFAAISRFARTGRLNDLKEMVRQDFENMSDEQLVDIAMNTTPNISVDKDGMVSTTDGNNQTMVGGWRNTDGSLMSDTEEGRQQMREELVKKRNKILKEIDQYEKSVETVRAIGNNSLTEDQVNELAWLDWKAKMFEDRFSSIKEETDQFISSLSHSLEGFIYDAENDNRENMERQLSFSIDQNTKEGKVILDNIKAIKSFIDTLSKTNSSLQLGAVLEANKQITDAITDDVLYSSMIEEISGRSHSEFTDFMDKVADAMKIAKATKTFNDRYKEFVENPIELIKNRSKVAQKVEKKVKDIKDRKRQNMADNIARRFDFSASVSTVARTIQENQKDIDSIGGIDTWVQGLPSEAQKKVRQAINFQKGVNSIKEKIDASEDIESEKLKRIAKSLVDRAASQSVSIEDLQEQANRLLNDSTVDNEIVKATNITDDRQLEEQIADIKEATKKIFDDTFDEVIKAVKDFDAMDEAQQAEEERVKKGSKVKESPEAPMGTPKENPNPRVPKDTEPPYKPPMEPHQASRAVKGANNRTNGELQGANDEEYHRNQLSESYFYGVDKTSYYDFAMKNRNAIPTLTDYTEQQYLSYIKAVSEYLDEKGAANYIKYHLQVGDTLEFIIDDTKDSDGRTLNDRAGTTVVLIQTKDANGQPQIIGSMPTNIDFNSITKKPVLDEEGNPTGEYIRDPKGRTLAQRNPGRYALYQSIVEEYNSLSGEERDGHVYHTTKVDRLMGGSLPISTKESTVEDIFANTGHEPIIGVVDNNGQIKTGNQAIDDLIVGSDWHEAGQVFVLIETNTGSYIPALTYSTPLSDIIGNKDDWYISKILDKLQAATSELNVVNSTYNKELFRWLQLPGLNASFTYKNSKGRREVDTSRDLVNATHLRLVFDSGKEGDPYVVLINLSEDKTIPREEAYKKLSTAISLAKKVTTNVITSELNNRVRRQDYTTHISKYLSTNIMRGETHTMNDWFTYEANTPRDNGKELRKSHNQDARINEQPSLVPPIVTVEGQSFTVEGDNVWNDDGELATEEEIKKVKEQMQRTPEPAKASEPIKTSESLEDVLADLAGDTKEESKSTKPRRKFLLVTDTEEKPVSEQEFYKDVNRVKQMFPNLDRSNRIVVVNGLIKLVDEKGNPIEAYGKFEDGVIYLSDKSPRGSSFHEAFHYVIDTLLSQDELDSLFKEAETKYKDSDKMVLEERMAEDFRSYMNGMEDKSIRGFIKRVFEKLKNIIDSIANRKQSMSNLFYNIYANRYSGSNDIQDTFENDYLKYQYEKTDYDKLDADTKAYLEQRGISKESYESLSAEQREYLLHCM